MSHLRIPRARYGFGSGIVVPPRYAVPTTRYPSPGGRPAICYVEFLSSTLADYDGQGFSLSYPLRTAPTATASHGWTFDDDTVPPSTATAVNLSGITASAAAVAAQFAVAVNAYLLVAEFSRQVWTAEVLDGTAIVKVSQNWVGARGNLPVLIGVAWNDLVRVNDVTEFEVRQPMFYNGADINLPACVGPRRGLLPNAAATPQSLLIA